MPKNVEHTKHKSHTELNTYRRSRGKPLGQLPSDRRLVWTTGCQPSQCTPPWSARERKTESQEKGKRGKRGKGRESRERERASEREGKRKSERERERYAIFICHTPPIGHRHSQVLQPLHFANVHVRTHMRIRESAKESASARARERGDIQTHTFTSSLSLSSSHHTHTHTHTHTALVHRENV